MWLVKTLADFFFFTHHTLVGFLSRVDPHVDEQLVAGVEGLVAADAAGPEAGEVLTFALVDVDFLYVPHKLLLLLIGGTAVYPATHLLLRRRSSFCFVPLRGSVGHVPASDSCFKSQGGGRCCWLTLGV